MYTKKRTRQEELREIMRDRIADLYHPGMSPKALWDVVVPDPEYQRARRELEGFQRYFKSDIFTF